MDIYAVAKKILKPVTDGIGYDIMTMKSWKYARENHTIDIFHRQYKNAITDIIENENRMRGSRLSTTTIELNNQEFIPGIGLANTLIIPR